MTENKTPGLDMFHEWAKGIVQLLGFSTTGIVHPENARLVIMRFKEASDEYQSRFLSDPNLRGQLRIALRNWTKPTCSLADIRNLSPNKNDRDPKSTMEFDLNVDGETIHISVNAFGSGYKVQTVATTLSYVVDKGKVPALTDEKLKAIAYLVKVCRKGNYAFL